MHDDPKQPAPLYECEPRCWRPVFRAGAHEWDLMPTFSVLPSSTPALHIPSAFLPSSQLVHSLEEQRQCTAVHCSAAAASQAGMDHRFLKPGERHGLSGQQC
ncbi:hypothetical protein ABPG75_008996 [Micractinium tetrahymenae]